MDVCLGRTEIAQTAMGHFLENVEVMYNIASSELAGCRKCRPNMLALQDIFDKSRFPKVKTVKVSLDWQDSTIVGTHKALLTAYNTTFTCVGSFQLVAGISAPKINVEYTALKQVWRYFIDYLSAHGGTPEISNAQKALPHIRRKFLLRFGGMLKKMKPRLVPLPSGAAATGSRREIALTLLKPPHQDEDMYKRLTGDFLRCGEYVNAT